MQAKKYPSDLVTVMKATIHQSYFIPWLGYFSKLAFSDVFVVLDDVLFRKRHYFDRTQYINMHGEIKWLSLPVGQNFGKPCNQVELSPPDNNYVNNIIKTIEFSYAKANYFSAEWGDLKEALAEPLQNHSGLVPLNISIINNIMALLRLRMPPLHFSSNLLHNCSDPTERILRICDQLKVNTVIVGNGMSLKVHEWKLLTDNGIEIEMQDYFQLHPEYAQVRRKISGFKKGLTIIDAILNTGREETRDYITNAKYRPQCLELQR